MNPRILQAAAITGAVIFSIMVLTSPSAPLPIPAPGDLHTDAGDAAAGGSISIVATGLDRPRAIATYENRMFITEQGGAVRVVEDGRLLEGPLAVFRGADAFDAGLLGIAVHPDFEHNHYVYVFVTYVDQDDGGGGEGDADGAEVAKPTTHYNKIVRITESDNRLVDAVDILDGIPASRFTNGGFLKFGPDGMLYAGTGTVSEASHLPQDVESLAGKILRINDDGSIPADNPFGPDSAVYTTGHRNPQGMAWDADGIMYVAEHGPEKNDEINVVVPGADYGWPRGECSDDENNHNNNNGSSSVGGPGRAILCYDPSIEPGGIAFYGHDRLGLEHPFVMASLRASNLYEIDFEEGLPSQKPVLSGAGRIRDVVAHPGDGTLYVITSNTDGKGFAGADDDRLIRIMR